MSRPDRRIMVNVKPEDMEFLEPWEHFSPGQSEAFVQELAREVAAGHELHEVKLLPLGHSSAADDALFGMDDSRVVQVHLTWSRQAEQPPWPSHRAYRNVDEWIKEMMLPEHERC